MVSTDQGTAVGTRLSRAQRWMLTVSCLCVALVVAAMAALYSALPGIAADTGVTQQQLTWVVDGYTLALATRRCARGPARPPRGDDHRNGRIHSGFGATAALRGATVADRCARGGRSGCGLRHALDPVAAHRGISGGAAWPGGRHLGRGGGIRWGTGDHRLRHTAAVAVVAVGLRGHDRRGRGPAHRRIHRLGVDRCRSPTPGPVGFAQRDHRRRRDCRCRHGGSEPRLAGSPRPRSARGRPARHRRLRPGRIARPAPASRRPALRRSWIRQRHTLTHRAVPGVFRPVHADRAVLATHPRLFAAGFLPGAGRWSFRWF